MELPFGFEFEESVFEAGRRERGRRSSLSPAYSARCCEPEWFCQETGSGEDDAESVNVKKFRGDLAYKRQEFKRNGATNTDHVTVILGLQLVIYRRLEHIERIIKCLHGLIMLHPFHPGHWKLLAEAYMSLCCSPAPLRGDGSTAGNSIQSSSTEANFQCHEKNSWKKDVTLQFSPQINGSCGSCEECQRLEVPIIVSGKSEAQHRTKSAELDSMGQERSEDICIYSCASFVRARLLFQLMQLNQSSFALESNLKAQQEIEDKVASFGLKEDVLFLMTEAMGEDLVPEKLKEDAQGEVKCLGATALTSMLTASAVEFERKWFQRLRKHFPPLDCRT
ncbi:uncharacterized protein C8orf76 homolog isoform X2 [Elgaria multicarinata webbii]|uniref:uncharacterized protein C8orf76 homolog isoform X2 n=1 Tax=Elgaria multicarinata webbii TaxID=159646 RepID=UPI002FCCCEC6